MSALEQIITLNGLVDLEVFSSASFYASGSSSMVSFKKNNSRYSFDINLSTGSKVWRYTEHGPMGNISMTAVVDFDEVFTSSSEADQGFMAFYLNELKGNMDIPSYSDIIASLERLKTPRMKEFDKRCKKMGHDTRTIAYCENSECPGKIKIGIH